MLKSRTQSPKYVKTARNKKVFSPLSKLLNQMDVFATPSGGILRYQYLNNCKYNAMNSTNHTLLPNTINAIDKQLYN